MQARRTALVIIEAQGTTRKVFYEDVHPLLNVPMTAWAMVEGLPLTRLDVRHLERFPLGTKYTDIVKGVRERLARLPEERYLAVDQTGVGRGVYELLGPLNPIGVTITSGDAVTRGEGRLEWRVPKRNLVAEMQVGLEGPTLKIAKKLPMAQTLVDELVNFRMKISEAGHDHYGAWRESIHDDLVLACAISCWVTKMVVGLKQQAMLQDIEARQMTLRLAEASRISAI